MLTLNNRVYRSDDFSQDFLTTDINNFLDIKLAYMTEIANGCQDFKDKNIPSIFLRGAITPATIGNTWHAAPILPSTHVSIKFQWHHSIPPQHINFPKPYLNAQINVILNELQNTPMHILSRQDHRYHIHEADVAVQAEFLTLNLSIVDPNTIESLRLALQLQTPNGRPATIEHKVYHSYRR